MALPLCFLLFRSYVLAYHYCGTDKLTSLASAKKCAAFVHRFYLFLFVFYSLFSAVVILTVVVLAHTCVNFSYDLLLPALVETLVPLQPSPPVPDVAEFQGNYTYPGLGNLTIAPVLYQGTTFLRAYLPPAQPFNLLQSMNSFL